MSSAPPTRFSATRILLNRAARRLLWPRPALYFPFGMLRRRGNVFSKDVRSFTSADIRGAGTLSRGPRFFPPIQGCGSSLTGISRRSLFKRLKCGIPGFVLIRNPLDAAVSWAIHENETLEEAIAYWNDYYETLLPFRSQLFLARFEEVTTDFGGVMRAFNARWGTSYVPFEHTPENAASCFQITDDGQPQAVRRDPRNAGLPALRAKTNGQGSASAGTEPIRFPPGRTRPGEGNLPGIRSLSRGR